MGEPLRDEEELVQACRKGDEQAFAYLVDRYKGLVSALAFSGTCDLTLSQDLAQETFATAWRRLDTLTDPGRLRAWLCGIVRHLVQEARRRRVQEKERAASAGAPKGMATPREVAMERERAQMLGEALALLPEAYRLPLVLYYFEGHSVRDVAEALGLSEEAARQRLTRGRQKLRESLAGVVEEMLDRARPTGGFVAAVLGRIGFDAASPGAGASGSNGPVRAPIQSGTGLVRLPALASGKALLGVGAVAALGILAFVAVQPAERAMALPDAPAVVTASVAEPMPAVAPAPAVPAATAVETPPKKTEQATPSAVAHMLRFPDDVSIGELFVRDSAGPSAMLMRAENGHAYEVPPPRFVAEARGDVSVPAGKYVSLVLSPRVLRVPRALEGLAPGDVQAIVFRAPLVGGNGLLPPQDALMEQIGRLSGLESFSLYGMQVSEDSLRCIGALRSLRLLELGTTPPDERAFAHLRGLQSLETLELGLPIGRVGLGELTGLSNLRELSIRCDWIRGPELAGLANVPLAVLELRGRGYSARGISPRNGLCSDLLPHLQGVATLRTLVLAESDRITDGAAPHLARLTQLERLSFVHIDSITDASMPYLQRLTNLRGLDLGDTRITDRGLAALPALPNLEELRLPNSHPAGPDQHTVTDMALVHASRLPRLQYLWAGGAWSSAPERGQFSDDGLQMLTTLGRLEFLLVSSGTAVTDEGMAYLASLSRLKTLNVASHAVSNEGMAQLAKLTTLRSLNVRFPRVSVAGLNHLNTLTNLEQLVVYEAVQDGAGLRLGALAQLRSLDLNVVWPSAERGMGGLRDQDLAWLAGLSRLERLQVNTNPELTDAGVMYLAGLGRLEQLLVGGDGVGDAGLACVAGLPNLFQLSISGNFSDVGMRRLGGLKRMQSLTVNSRHPMSRATEDYLRRSLPNLYDSAWMEGLAPAS